MFRFNDYWFSGFNHKNGLHFREKFKFCHVIFLLVPVSKRSDRAVISLEPHILRNTSKRQTTVLCFQITALTSSGQRKAPHGSMKGQTISGNSCLMNMNHLRWVRAPWRNWKSSSSVDLGRLEITIKQLSEKKL